MFFKDATMFRILIFAVMQGFIVSSLFSDEAVTVLKTPDNGIQPQAVTDRLGNLHLVYFEGQPVAGNLVYVRRDSKKDSFSPSLRVNHEPNSSIATGTVRGVQLAIGRDNTVHVVWNGSGANDKTRGLFYSRLEQASTAFERERDLMRGTSELDGGGTIAADHLGNVFVAWHAVQEGQTGEKNRTVWLAQSTDEGKVFSKPRRALSDIKGVCGCCSMRAVADGHGALYMLFRSATGGENRDIFLLASMDNAVTFGRTLVQQWKIGACPMSTMAMAPGPRGMVAAWDTDGQIYLSTIAVGSSKLGKPMPVPGRGLNRKHPAIAFNSTGEMLIAWTEGTGWEKGGDLVWEIYNKDGQPSDRKGIVRSGIPVWGLPTVVATGDHFTIIH
jgi:hypothetical protein